MFHSEALSNSVSNLKPLAERFRERADQVSNDIRALEKFLQENFFGIEIGINVAVHEINNDNLNLLKMAGMAKDLDYLLKEFLTWGKDESSGKFRLLYETHSLKGGTVPGFVIWPEKRPLIECSLFCRLRMHPNLSLLADHISTVLKME